jgi:hypothetical protein
MENDGVSRRSLLQAVVATIGAGALPVSWAEVVLVAHESLGGAQPPRESKVSFLSPAEAADVAAVAAQIIPTDDTPGAREAGVVNFIDRALATFLSQLASDYRAQLAEFQAVFRQRHPGAASFASLPSAQQVEYLAAIAQVPNSGGECLWAMEAMLEDGRPGS